MKSRLFSRLGRLEAAIPTGDLGLKVLFIKQGESQETASQRMGIDPTDPRLLVVEFVAAVDGRPAQCAA